MNMEEKKEHPSTYFVQDRSSEEELKRLQVQDSMLTTKMGGVLAEQDDPERFKQVLDVGCGTGGWIIEAAKKYPTMTHLIGVDVSKTMVDYARSQAEAEGVADRVEFHVMDALRMLEFPRGYFDLINQRLGVSYLRTWDWPKLLSEYQRVGKQGAVIRITESDVAHGNNASFTQLSDLVLQTLHSSGHLKAPEMNATIDMLAPLLHQHGIKNVQTRKYDITYPIGAPEGQAFYEDMQHFFRTLVPFLRKWSCLPDNYDEIYQKAFTEMKQPDFVGAWTLITAWGTNGGLEQLPPPLLESH